MTNKLKIQPFDRAIDFQPLPQVRCTGVIGGHGLGVCLGESRFDLVGELRSDDYGPYVLVEPTEREYPFGYRLTVEQTFEEGEEPGTHISLREINPIVSELERQHPDKNVICPPITAMSLHFNSHGTIDGWSSAGPAEPKRPSAH